MNTNTRLFWSHNWSCYHIQ